VHRLQMSALVFPLILGSVPSHAQSVVTVTCNDHTRVSGGMARPGACIGHGGVEAPEAAKTLIPSARDATPVLSIPVYPPPSQQPHGGFIRSGNIATGTAIGLAGIGSTEF